MDNRIAEIAVLGYFTVLTENSQLQYEEFCFLCLLYFSLVQELEEFPTVNLFEQN